MKKFLLCLCLFLTIPLYSQNQTWNLEKPYLNYLEIPGISANIRLNPRLLGVTSVKMAILFHNVLQNHFSFYGGLNPMNSVFYKGQSYTFFGGTGGVGYSWYFNTKTDPDTKKNSAYLLGLFFGGGGGYMVISGGQSEEGRKKSKELGYKHNITGYFNLTLENKFLWNNQGLSVKTGVEYNVFENSWGLVLGLSYLL